MGRSRRRRLGQNFLVDPGVARRILDLLEPEPPRVLEIGPGRGALTRGLLERFPRVLALELDERLVEDLAPLREDGLELRHADALAEPLDPFLGAEAPWQVVANLPYSVGTPILRRLLPRHDLLARIVVMLQREVAERIVARPGERAHGLLALERAAWTREARIAFTVPPGVFRPRPKVLSAVIVLEPAPPAFAPAELAAAFRLARHALTRPRKTLANAVKPLVEPRAIEAVGLDPGARPGTVPLEDWVALAGAGE